MKITVYTLVTDDKNGTEADVFANEAEAEAAAIAYLTNDWMQLRPDEQVPDSFADTLSRLQDSGFMDTVRVESHEIELAEPYYVTMTWDDWPEGGSYGTVVAARSRDEAENMCRQEMAQSRVVDEWEDDTTVEDVLEHYEDRWHTVDCYRVIDGIMHQLRIVTE